MAVVVYEGVFDPPHLLHIWLAQLAAESYLNPTKVIVVPSSDAAAAVCSGKGAVTEQRLRLSMCMESFKGLHPSIIVSHIAMKLGLIYTVDVLEALQSLWSGDDDWYWMCGTDWVDNLSSFHNLEKLQSQATFLMVKRAGYSLSTHVPGIRCLELDNPQVSSLKSTFIRERVKEGKIITPFVTAYVDGYIKAYSLYSL